MDLNSQIIRSEIQINMPVEQTFVMVFRHDLLDFFKTLPCMPVFTHSAGRPEHFRPGFEHAIYFKNGDRAKRRLVCFLPDMSFTASVYGFSSGYLGILEIEYQYYFSADEKQSGFTEVRSEYRFKFHRGIRALLFRVFWKSKTQDALDSFLVKIREAVQDDPF